MTRSRASRLLLRWLTLTLAGVFAWAGAHALWACWAFGLPAYDWLWYACALSLCLAVLCHAGWQVPLTRWHSATYLALLIGITLDYNAFGTTLNVPVRTAPPVALAFWAYTDFTTMPEPVLTELHDAHATLYLHVQRDGYSGEPGTQLAAGLHRLAQHNINAVLMPYPGEFFSSPVIEAWQTETLHAAQFVARTGLTNVVGLIADVETPLNQPPLATDLERARFEHATAIVRAVQTTLRRDYPTLPLGATANWVSYEDGADGDDDLARQLRVPFNPDEWDFLNLMTYSSYMPATSAPYWTYASVTALHHRYPTRPTSYLIGLVGGGYPGEPLLTFDDLVQAAQIARGAGAQTIVVFQLNGALKVFGPDFVSRFATAVNGPNAPATLNVPFDRRATAHFAAFGLLDALWTSHPFGWLAWSAWGTLSAGIAWRSVSSKSI